MPIPPSISYVHTPISKLLQLQNRTKGAFKFAHAKCCICKFYGLFYFSITFFRFLSNSNRHGNSFSISYPNENDAPAAQLKTAAH